MLLSETRAILRPRVATTSRLDYKDLAANGGVDKMLKVTPASPMHESDSHSVGWGGEFHLDSASRGLVYLAQESDVSKKNQTLDFRDVGNHILGEKIWPPFRPNARLAIATLVSLLGAALSNAAGVGGGGLFVPMFNLLLGYDAKTSTALSKSMIMGGAIASVFFNIQLKHPSKPCALIDYDVARLMQPMLLLGISTGVMFNVMLPPWLLVALLFVVLLVMTMKTMDKGVAIRCKERNAIAAASTVTALEIPSQLPVSTLLMTATIDAPQATLTTPLLQLPGSQEGEPASLVGTEDGGPTREPDEGTKHTDQASPSGGTDCQQLGGRYELPDRAGLGGPTGNATDFMHGPSIVERCLIGVTGGVATHRLLDWPALSQLFLVWGLFLLIQLTKKASQNCSTGYWMLTASQVPVSLIATIVSACRLNTRHRKRCELRQGLVLPSEEETCWDVQQVCLYPLFALIAGVMGGLLGIGGGMVMGPVFLELGLTPQVTAATSTFIVVFSSSLSVIEFHLLGRLPTGVALYFCGLAVAAAFCGLSIIRAYVVRSGRASIIIFLLGGIIGISGIILGTLGTFRIFADWEAGVADFGFRSPCTPSY